MTWLLSDQKFLLMAPRHTLNEPLGPRHLELYYNFGSIHVKSHVFAIESCQIS